MTDEIPTYFFPGTASAEQAEQWGLIWRCVDDDALAGEARSLVEHLSRQPTRGR